MGASLSVAQRDACAPRAWLVGLGSLAGGWVWGPATSRASDAGWWWTGGWFRGAIYLYQGWLALLRFASDGDGGTEGMVVHGRGQDAPGRGLASSMGGVSLNAVVGWGHGPPRRGFCGSSIYTEGTCGLSADVYPSSRSARRAAYYGCHVHALYEWPSLWCFPARPPFRVQRLRRQGWICRTSRRTLLYAGT